jgi:hypothetical protein
MADGAYGVDAYVGSAVRDYLKGGEKGGGGSWGIKMGQVPVARDLAEGYVLSLILKEGLSIQRSVLIG